MTAESDPKELGRLEILVLDDDLKWRQLVAIDGIAPGDLVRLCL